MENKELVQAINDAVDSVMIPFIGELLALGVEKDIVMSAMYNITARAKVEDDDTTEG